MYSVENDSIFVFLYFNFIVTFFLQIETVRAILCQLNFRNRLHLRKNPWLEDRSMLCHAIEGGGGGGGRRGVGVLPTTCSQGFATSRMHIYIAYG